MNYIIFPSVTVTVMEATPEGPQRMRRRRHYLLRRPYLLRYRGFPKKVKLK